MIIFDKEYDGETIADMEEDVFDAVNSIVDDGEIPVDAHGFTKGTFRVTISWSEDNE